MDLTIAISHLPLLDLGRQLQTLLSEHNQPFLLARRWSGHWDQEALRSLTPMIANCTRTQIKAVLGHVLRVTRSTISACWRHFLATARELPPPPRAMPTPIPRKSTDCHRLGPSLRRGPRLITEVPSPCFVGPPTELFFFFFFFLAKSCVG